MPKESVNIQLLIIFLIIGSFVFTLGVIYLFMRFQIKKNKILKSKEDLKISFEKTILQTQIEIQEQTLKTISEEIHDNVGQVLSLAKLNLNTFESNPEKKLQATKELVSKAINDLRDLSRSLHGDKISETGLQEAVSNELRILQNTGQYETRFRITGNPCKLEPQKEMVLFRIVQEALHNGVKHARAGTIEVTMNYEPAVFSLTVRDDGKGFNAEELEAAQTGIGLKSMRNRANMIGGNLSILSEENKGTSITVELPTGKPLNQ